MPFVKMTQTLIVGVVVQSERSTLSLLQEQGTSVEEFKQILRRLKPLKW